MVYFGQQQSHHCASGQQDWSRWKERHRVEEFTSSENVLLGDLSQKFWQHGETFLTWHVASSVKLGRTLVKNFFSPLPGAGKSVSYLTCYFNWRQASRSRREQYLTYLALNCCGRLVITSGFTLRPPVSCMEYSRSCPRTSISRTSTRFTLLQSGIGAKRTMHLALHDLQSMLL